MIGAWASLKYTLIPGKTTKRMSWKDWIMHLPVVDYYRWMREAYKRGKNSVDFIFVDWESLFNKPFKQQVRNSEIIFLVNESGLTQNCYIFKYENTLGCERDYNGGMQR